MDRATEPNMRKTARFGHWQPYYLVLFTSASTVASSATALQYAMANPYFTYVAGQLDSYGLAGCNMISNIWTDLPYYDFSAYPPYYMNGTLARYPIVVFDIGVADYRINLTGYAVVYGKNLTVCLPPRWAPACRGRGI